MPAVIQVERFDNESDAAYACRFTLECIAQDADVAYLMLGTEAMRLLIQGVCDDAHLNPIEIERSVRKKVQRLPGKPDVVKLREQVSKLSDDVTNLESKLEDCDHLHPQDSDLDRDELERLRRVVWKIQDRVHMAELGVEALDHETIRDILNSRFTKARG